MLSSMAAQTQRIDPPLPIVIVESHNQALVHIHQQLRKQKRLGIPFQMLHFDSHADMACPGPHVPAYCCFRPSFQVPASDDHVDGHAEEDPENRQGLDLYDLLNSTTSGIAEWILPLVLAADLKEIHWIRPPWQTDAAYSEYLISKGLHQYRVGAWSEHKVVAAVESFGDLPMEAQVKVDSPLLYYMEDDSTVSSEELMLSQLASLHVLEEPHQLAMTTHPYVLDVCLDYFCCINPFIADLEIENPSFATAFRRAVAGTKVYRTSSSDSSTPDDDEDNASEPLKSGHHALEHTLAFRAMLAELLQGAVVERPSDDEVLRKFAPFFDSRNDCLDLMRSLVDRLLDNEDQDGIPSLARMAIEAIPYAMMPHDAKRVETQENEYPWTEERIRMFEDTLAQLKSSPPFLITIARSACDGFTPLTVVNEIQDRIVALIRASKLLNDRGCVVVDDWIVEDQDES